MEKSLCRQRLVHGDPKDRIGSLEIDPDDPRYETFLASVASGMGRNKALAAVIEQSLKRTETDNSEDKSV